MFNACYNVLFQEFLAEQSLIMARVGNYCRAANLSVPLDPYTFSYDPGTQLLVCRNHKASRAVTM